MPIYEFACHHCRSIFQFFARRVGDQKVPSCPKCGRSEMERVLSRFAVARSSKTSSKESPSGERAPAAESEDRAPDLDDPFAKMTPAQQAHAEREMFRLMEQAESLDERDPRQLGTFLRRMTEIVGDEAAPPEMKEAIRRLEAGEDPEKLEEEYGDLLGLGEEGGAGGGEYSYDDGLYDM